MTALELACRCVSGHGFHVVRTPNNGWPYWWVKADWRKLRAVIAEHLPFGDITVTAVPLLELENFRLSGDSPVLWVKTESRDSVRRLARFKPEPTLILREGSTVRQVALWRLTRPCPADKLERANGRLSYALRCKLKHGSAGFEFHPPGTVIRQKRREIQVTAVGGTGEQVGVGRLLGGLRDRPDPPDWRKA